MLGGLGAAVLLVGGFTLLLWPGAGPELTTSRPGTRWVGGTAELDQAIASGATLTVDRAGLPSGRPLVLALELGVPSADLEPRPVRVIAPDGRLLETSGPVDPEDRLTTSLSIDPDWLTPGRYIVEVKTTERAHFPLRRYAIEVK
jgi:hypothetical protein